MTPTTPKAKKTIFALFALLMGTVLCASQEKPARDDALLAMKKATVFMMERVSLHGGFVWKYSEDLSERWGEIPARKSQIWVQPPGTSSVGEIMLEAFRTTRDPMYLKYAEQAAAALVYGQHPEGGWHYFIDFEPAGIGDYYREIASKCWGWEEYYHYDGNCTFDDGVHSSSTEFLLDLYLTTLDPKYRMPLDKALDFVLRSQFDNGAWPQRYPLRNDYTSCYTFNDGVISGNIDLLLDAYRKLGDERYLKAARGGMDFVADSQLPPPQAGWGQQHSRDMRPAKARNYEPAAVEPRQAIENIALLEDFYKITGDGRYLRGIPSAIRWLENSVINRDPAKTDEGKAYTHAAFYEVGSNRPLYAHRKKSLAELDPNDPGYGYWVDFEFGNFPGHYGMTAVIDIPALRREFERVRSLSPARALEEYRKTREEESGAPGKADLEAVARILRTQDERGTWITDLTIPYYPDFKDRAKARTIRGFTTSAYIENVKTLLTYIGTGAQ